MCSSLNEISLFFNSIAFVEFSNKTIAEKVCQKKQVTMIQDRVLIVEFVENSRVGNVNQTSKVNDNNNEGTSLVFGNALIKCFNVDMMDRSFFSLTVAALPNDTLFLGNLSYSVGKKDLKKVFEKAVDINIPLNQGKRRGYVHVLCVGLLILFGFYNKRCLNPAVILCRFAFIKFATVAEAEKALKLSQNMKFGKKEVRVQFQKMEEKPDQTEGM